MELKTFYLAMDQAERDSFATRCETSAGHFRNVVYGKLCGEKLAVNIERESAGAVRCEDLRPDVDWAYLRGTDCPPQEAAPLPPAPEPVHECASGDPRYHLPRRAPEKRQFPDHRKEEV